MKKGYWIGRVDVGNAEAYKEYVVTNGPVFAKFGGRFIVRGGEFRAVEGQAVPAISCLNFPPIRQRWDAGIRPNTKPSKRSATDMARPRSS